jgi:beta-glucosidase/6-phospho-beta-glucosidase/beta-galactosidase
MVVCEQKFHALMHFLVYADGEGRVNPEGVAYYNNLINYLLQKGME